MKLKSIFPILFTFVVIFIFYKTKVTLFKFYPVAVNFAILSVFVGSLFTKETVIQRFAKAIDGELDDFASNYTRKLTYVWCGFLLANFLISLATVFMSDKLWIVYNGCISYMALGTFFAVEYIVRVVLRNRHRKMTPESDKINPDGN